MDLFSPDRRQQVKKKEENLSRDDNGQKNLEKSRVTLLLIPFHLRVGHTGGIMCEVIEIRSGFPKEARKEKK